VTNLIARDDGRARVNSRVRAKLRDVEIATRHLDPVPACVQHSILHPRENHQLVELLPVRRRTGEV